MSDNPQYDLVSPELLEKVAELYVLGVPRTDIYTIAGLNESIFNRLVKSVDFLEIMERKRIELIDAVLSDRKNQLGDIITELTRKLKTALSHTQTDKKEVIELNILLKEFREYLKLEQKVVFNKADSVQEVNVNQKIMQVNVDLDKDDFAGKLDTEMIKKLVWGNTDEEKSEN